MHTVARRQVPIHQLGSQPRAVDVAQIINKIRHNLNEGKSTYPSTRRRPSSGNMFGIALVSVGEVDEGKTVTGTMSEVYWHTEGVIHSSFTCDRCCGPENLGYHSWRTQAASNRKSGGPTS